MTNLSVKLQGVGSLSALPTCCRNSKQAWVETNIKTGQPPKWPTRKGHTHTCGKEVEGGVSGDHPESVVLSAEGLDTSSVYRRGQIMILQHLRSTHNPPTFSYTDFSPSSSSTCLTYTYFKHPNTRALSKTKCTPFKSERKTLSIYNFCQWLTINKSGIKCNSETYKIKYMTLSNSTFPNHLWCMVH